MVHEELGTVWVALRQRPQFEQHPSHRSPFLQSHGPPSGTILVQSRGGGGGLGGDGGGNGGDGGGSGAGGGEGGKGGGGEHDDVQQRSHHSVQVSGSEEVDEAPPGSVTVPADWAADWASEDCTNRAHASERQAAMAW